MNYDPDKSTYIGDHKDGVFYSVEWNYNGWYLSAQADSETEHCTEYIIKDSGPFFTKWEAEQAGRDIAIGWCRDHGVKCYQ